MLFGKKKLKVTAPQKLTPAVCDESIEIDFKVHRGVIVLYEYCPNDPLSLEEMPPMPEDLRKAYMAHMQADDRHSFLWV